MKRILSLVLSAALIIVLAVPVKAESNDSGWTELLEISSVQSNGSNNFTVYGTSGSVTIPLYAQKRLRKIDMLIWNPSGQRFSSATVTAGGSTISLEIFAIGGNLTRVVGYVPNTTYNSITVKFSKATSSTQTYELLSCKVTALGVQEFLADAEVYLDAWGVTDYFSTNYNIPFWWDQYGEVPVIYEWLSAVLVHDWQKYDTLSIWGSATSASIESIRVSIGTTALDYSVNYIDVEGQDSQIYGDVLVTPELGKYLFNITVDLSGVERTLTDPLVVYFTGSFNSMVQAYFNCQYVNGSIVTADTTEVTWWNRFTSFMSNLFGEGDGQESVDNLDAGSESISQGASDIGSFEQSQQDTLNTGFATITTGISFTSFSAALLFVQKYTNMAFNGISKYTIVFTLPLFLGLFFYLCSRIPGVTRWKSPPPRSKPSSKGGKSP